MNTKHTPKHAVPTHIDGVDVHVVGGEPAFIEGRQWMTLAPLDETDERLWEWSPDTGEVIQTEGGKP